MLTWCRLINWNKVTLIVQRAIKYANESRYSVTTILSFHLLQKIRTITFFNYFFDKHR